jgi:hypothetical protein
MEITEIKQQLTLSKVLHYYNLKPDKQLRLNCPFHDDKTPSLQVYYKTHTAYCFSSNCKTHGKSLDVIDFIMYMENITKHEAIKKAEQMITGESTTGTTKAQPKQEASRAVFLTQMFTYFKNAIHNSKPAQEYLQKRKLDNSKTEVGYNSGQFHHGARKDEKLINTCLKYGLLLDLDTKGRTGNPAYSPFGKWGLVFPLKDKEDQIVSLYFRSTLDDKKQRHFYLKDRHGLYPKYPPAETKKLILTESIIDAATLLEQEKIKTNYEVLSLYGTNGLTDEHTEAVSQLKQLEEIIFFLNGDQAGIKAVEKYAPMLKADYPKIKITGANYFSVPTNEIFFNPNAPYGGIDQNGNITSIPFVSLGHELSHGLDKLNGTLDLSTWSGNTTNAEKFATHIENQIRAEHGLPLRTHYGLINNNGVFSGDPTTQLINGRGESLFYQSNITINSPKMGGLMNDGRMFDKSWSFSVPYKYK